MTQPAAPQTQRMIAPDGAVTLVPVGKVTDFYQQGFDFVQGDTVHVKGKGGKLQALSTDQAMEHLESVKGLGAKVGSAQQFAKQKEAESVEGVGHAAAAFGAGAARGLTFGLSDAAIAKMGGAEQLRKYEEHQAGAGLAGEVLGLAAPVVAGLVTGGTSTGAALGAQGARVAARGAGALGRAAEVATALPRGVGMLGEGAGGLAARGVEALGASSGGLVSKVARGAAQGAAEMPFYAVGDAVSKAAIHDEELTAEKVLAAVGHGGAMGAVVGGGLPVAGRLLSGLGGLAKRGTAGASERLTAALGKDVPASMEKFSEQKALSFIGATPKERQALAKFGPEAEARAAALVRDELPAIEGKPFAQMTRDEAAGAASKHVEKLGAEYGEKFATIDGAVAKMTPAEQLAARPAVDSIITEARKVSDALRALPSSASQGHAAKLEREIQLLEEKAPGFTFEQWHGANSQFKADVRAAMKANDAYGPELKKLVRVIDGEITAKGQKVAERVGAQFAGEYAALNQRYATAKWVEKNLEYGAGKEATHRSLGFSEQVSALGASNLGSQLGASMAGPLGGLVGGAVFGLGSMAAANITRRYGDQVMSTIAKRAVDSDIVTAVARTIDDRIGTSVAKFFGTHATPTLGLPPGVPVLIERQDRQRKASLEERYTEERQQLANTLSAPRAITQAAEAVRASDPKLADAIMAKATSDAVWLQSKAPVAPQRPGFPQQFAAYKPSDTEMARFLRYARALDDPMTVLDDLEKRRVSREGVEVLKERRPRIYKQVQDAVMARMTDPSLPLPPYRDRIQLGILLDIPTDPSMEPAGAALYQQILTANAQPPEQDKARAQTNVSSKRSGNSYSNADRIGMGD